MAIFYDYIITVKENVSTLNKNIYLYRKNRNIDYYFTIKDASFKFTERQNENLVETANAKYATVKVLNPSGKRLITNKTSVVDGKVHFRITEALINEVSEVGVYVFQIDLYDDENGRVTIPPVINALYVLEPLFDDDEVDTEEISSEVGIAQVDVSWVEGQEVLETFDENGKYIKTYWREGDILTSGRLNKIEDALFNLSVNGGGGGGATSGYISTTTEENLLLSLEEDLSLNIDFSSPNIGKGTLKVLINDVESKSISILQGENTVTIEGNLFTKGNNKLTVYALDRTGVMTNDLTFTVRYGSTEIVSTFDSSLSYDYGSIVRYYFVPTAVDTSSELKFYMKIDDVIQEGVSCVSDTRGYYTFPNNLTVGNHYCEAWIEENGTTKSNILTFNLVILDESSLVINSTVKTESVEEGNQLSLDYRVYMKNNNTFNVKYYVDDELINTSTCTNAISYWTISTLTEGVHILKVVASDVTETVSDYVTWTINVTPSTYEMKTPVSTGSIALFTAKDRNNSDETRETWIGKNQDGENVTATLTNFAFNSDSGWIDNSLIISGDSYVEIPVKPLENNAKYGFTLDIEFTSKMIGVENAEVLTLWNETDNCGVKITTEQLIIRSKKDNECRLYFSDNEKVSVTFVIDRNEKVCKIFINGVMCQGFPLSDYIADGQTYLEDFTVDSNIILGGYGKNGYCKINNLRVYEVALSSDEVMNNFISNILDKTAQRNMVAFQTGDSLPTLTVTGDFAGLGKDDKKPCDVVFMSPDINLYGQSFTLTGKNSTIQYQGTSSMAYPIKNYKFKFKDKDGNKFKFKILGDGQAESIITLKCDYMSSGHWQNTGLAKWISDYLYHYDTKDEKSMNPMKWWSLQNGGSLSDTRESINGFPCRLILVNDGEGVLNEGQAEPTSGNTKDMGIFNFNLDKGCTDSFGLDNSIFSQCVSYEVSANSDTTAGAFVPYDSSKNTDQTELEYLQSSFELRYPDSEDVGEDYGFLGMTVDGTFSNDYGLKRVIDFVGNSTDEEFVNNFEEYFNKEYTFRYFLLVMTLAMVDNLGKNMMMDSWDGKIWYPRFYDLDTICSYDNSGAIKFDVDIEMEQGYWNTSQSRLWTRVRDLFHNELVETYKDMRNNGLDYTTLMSYFYGQQISKIPQSYYNKDADIKYIPYADQYLGKAHGDGYEHLKKWLKNRIIFTDTLFDFESAYNNDVLTIRVNTTEPMEITVETYTPLYQHISWKNNQMDKLKVDGKNPTTFTGQVDALTDQEVLIYGGSNIKRITGISTMNPDSMLIGSATRLVELVINDCPLLTDINSSKANLSAHTYLNKVDLSGCTALGGTLRLNNSPLIQEVNVKNTAITSVQLPSSIRNLTALRLPKAITSLELNDARLLNTLELEQGHNLNNISLTNCNNLTNCINFDLTQVPTIKLDNSYDTEELYMSKTTNLTLNNMKNLKRLIYIPNAEIEEFDLSNLMSASEYKITTFNCPNLTDFITTAQQRLSFGLESDGNIYPNQVFMASLLNLSNTQFKNIKLLCTTDLYKLMLPTTVKNFYCDSAFDLDTTVVTDGSYDVVHGDLIEPYTTNYGNEVLIGEDIATGEIKGTDDIWIQGKTVTHGTGTSSDGSIIDTDNGMITDYLPCKPNSFCEITCNQKFSSCIHFYDKNKQYISSLRGNNAISSRFGINGNSPSNTSFVIFSAEHSNLYYTLVYTKPIVPNIVPTSANGSLIYNVWSQLGTQPSSTSPYIWDLTGLKFKDFHTYGMNNWVKYKGYKVYTGDTLKKAIGSTYHYLQNPPGLLDGSNATAISIIKFPSQYTEVKMYNNLGVSFRVMPCFDGITKVYRANIENGGTYSMTKSNTLGIAVNDKTSNLKWVRFDFGDGNLYQINIDDLPNDTLANNEVFDIENSNDFIMDFSLGLTSITMPQRTTGYSVRLQNADITPNNYNTMLYPLFIDTTLPIVGKMDYSKYKGNNLSWAFAYTTDAVSRTPMDSRDMGNIKYDYNKLYNTDYVDITDVWVYKDTDCSSFSTNENITKAYIELTQDNYTSRVDEVLQYYSNCTDLYFFDDGSVTSLQNFFNSPNNQTHRHSIVNITFMEGYFDNTTNFLWCLVGLGNLESITGNCFKNNLSHAFRENGKLKTLDITMQNITGMTATFYNCPSLNHQFDFSEIDVSDNTLLGTFEKCSSLTYTPKLPTNYKGSLDSTFKETKITTAPVIPDGVTSLKNTFNSCTKLTTVGNIPTSCNDFQQAFYGCSKLISVPQEGWNGNMYQTFASCTSLNQKFIINSATSLSWTFAGSGLTITPTLPSKMNGIMDRCFRYCKLTTPPITPNGVTSLSYCYENNPLTSAPNIPSSCTDISNYISGCSKITEVAIPVDVVTNYSNALSSCSEITDIDWTGKRTTDFSLTLLKCPSYTQEDLKELVNENLEDLYKDKIKINYGSKITINNTETTL